MDLKLDRTTHDLEVSFYDLQLVTEQELMQQRLKQTLQFFLGEWFLDITEGIPYYEDIYIKAPIQVTVESIFKSKILGTPDVLSLEKFELEYDASGRKLSLDFEVTTTFGNISISEEL